MCLYEHTVLETSVQLSAVIKEKDDSAVDMQLKLKDSCGFFFHVGVYTSVCQK